MTRLYHFMGIPCTQLHMFYVANKSTESETSTYYNHYAFVCHFIFNLLKTTQWLYCSSYSNIIFIAIYNISIFSIGHIVLYCSSKYYSILILFPPQHLHVLATPCAIYYFSIFAFHYSFSVKRKLRKFTIEPKTELHNQL